MEQLAALLKKAIKKSEVAACMFQNHKIHPDLCVLEIYKVQMGSTGVTIEEDAAIRLTLHALKYPRASCNGILLGRIDDGEVIVSEIAPVCHTFTTLPGQMEIALCMVDKACQKSGEQTGIVGYYQCNERLGDLDLGLVGQKIADTISRLISGGKAEGVVLMVRCWDVLLTMRTCLVGFSW